MLNMLTRFIRGYPTDTPEAIPPEEVFLRGKEVGVSDAARIAMEQLSNDPQRGTWNDACRHIAQALYEHRNDLVERSIRHAP